MERGPRGPDSGGVSALVIDPKTPTTLYAASGGVFKSTDAGSTWSEVSAGLTLGGVSALVIDPKTPTTLYAGGGDVVFRSTDAGGTWSDASAGLAGGVSALVIDPKTPTTLYADTDSGVFRSIDSGASWGSSNFPGLPIFDPALPTTLYAGRDDAGVFESTDAGDTWSTINTGLPNTIVRTLAIDPITPGTLYAGTDSGVFSIQEVAACVGDCNGNGQVAINELLMGVNIVLGSRAESACPAFANSQGMVDTTRLVAGVNNALTGCGGGGGQRGNPLKIDWRRTGHDRQAAGRQNLGRVVRMSWWLVKRRSA